MHSPETFDLMKATLKRRPGSDGSHEVLELMRSSPSEMREGLLLFASLLMLRLLEHRDRELQAVADFEGRNRNPIFPDSGAWKFLAGHPHPAVSRFISQLATQRSSAEHSVHFLAATLNKLFAPSKYAKEVDSKYRLLPDFIHIIERFDFGDLASQDAASTLFEDLLEQYVRTEKFAGQFTTPPNLCRFMVDIAAPKAGERIYDPCFGMGSLLVNAAHRLQETKGALAPSAWAELQENSIFGIEQRSDLCFLASVRLMLAGIVSPRLECGDTLERDPSQQRSGTGFDCILAQPPFGLKFERAISSQYRIASSAGENLFLQHILTSLRAGGRAVVLVAHGLLYRGGADEQLRKLLLNEYRVNAVVPLPAGMLTPYTGIPTSLLVIQRLPPRQVVWFAPEEIVSKHVTQPQGSSPGYAMLVSTLRAVQQDGVADAHLLQQVERIAALEAAVFEKERTELELRRKELARLRETHEAKVKELENHKIGLKNQADLPDTFREVRADIEQTVADRRGELDRSKLELAAIETENPVTEHGKHILSSRIKKLRNTIRDCEEKIRDSQNQLSTLDVNISKIERISRELASKIPPIDAEIGRVREEMGSLPSQIGEVERRLADIHSNTKDWEALQELSDVAKFFLRNHAEEPRPIDNLPRGVVAISGLSAKKWELVARRFSLESLDEFLKGFTQVSTQSHVLNLNEIALVFSGPRYSRVPVFTIRKKQPETQQSIKTVRVQDLPQDVNADTESVPLVNPSNPRIIEAFVRPPRESDFLQAGDIVLSVGGTVGRVSIIADFPGRAVASNGLTVIRCQNQTTPQYLAALLRTEPYQRWLMESSSGAFIRHLSLTTLRRLRIPLPPPEVQQRLSTLLRPAQSAQSVLSILSTRPKRTPVADSILEDAMLKQWAALSANDIQPGSGLGHLLSRALSKSHTWSPLLRREPPDDPTTGSLLAWLEALQEFAETQELQRENDRWAALQAWFTHFNDDRGPFVNAFRRLREIRNRVAHGIEPAEDPGVLWKYSMLEKLRDNLRLVWEFQTKALAEKAKIIASVSPSALTVGVESELTFSIHNDGALPLRRITVTTSPFESSSVCSSLSSKDEYRWTLKVRPREIGKIDLTVKWNAVRMDRTPVSGDLALAIEVHSLREQSAVRRLETSPYITGTSLSAEDAELFFGREDMLTEIKRNLRTSGPSTVLILEGVRRVGKTSLLKQLSRPALLPKWICVYYNFQGASGAQDKHGVPTGTIFYEIAKAIVLACHSAGLQFDLPHVCYVNRSLKKREFADKMYESLRPRFEQTNAPFELFQIVIEGPMLSLGEKRLLLLLDEFDKVQSGIENGVTSPQVPDNFRNLFHTYPQVSAILTGAQLMKRLRREYFNPLFGIGRPIPIGPLDPKAARELVVKPVRGTLVYSDPARDWIVEACACQPFLIQHVCSRVFDVCIDGKETNVSTDTVKKAAETWLKTDTHFDTVWRDDIHDPRRQYIAWLVYELQSGPDPVTFDLLRQTLEKRGLYGSTALTGYLEDLRDLAVIRQQEKDRIHSYTIAIPLFAEWLRIRIDASQYRTKAMNVDGGKL